MAALQRKLQQAGAAGDCPESCMHSAPLFGFGSQCSVSDPKLGSPNVAAIVEACLSECLSEELLILRLAPPISGPPNWGGGGHLIHEGGKIHPIDRLCSRTGGDRQSFKALFHSAFVLVSRAPRISVAGRLLQNSTT